WNPKTGEVRAAVHLAKAAAAKPVIPPASAWLAVLPDGHLAWATGAQWTIARVSRAPDGVVHAVWADAKRLAHSTSQDLLSWSAPMFTDVMAGKSALDLNSPNLFHDGSQFIVTWSCTIARNFIQAFQEDVEDNPRIWYAITRD